MPTVAMGGAGVISVLSGLLPAGMQLLCRLAREGDYAAASALQLYYLPLIHALFSEVNPIPVKCAMNHMGFCESEIRLPLTEMEADHEEKLVSIMKGLNLL